MAEAAADKTSVNIVDTHCCRHWRMETNWVILGTSHVDCLALGSSYIVAAVGIWDPKMLWCWALRNNSRFGTLLDISPTAFSLFKKTIIKSFGC